MKNIKLGNNTLNGVDTLRIEDADAAGVFDKFLDTTDATAVADDIVSGKTAYVNGSKIIGTSVNNTYIKLVKDIHNSSPDYERICYKNGEEVEFNINDYNFLNPIPVTLNSGDEMLKIPAFYYSRQVSQNGIETIYLSDTGLKAPPVDLHPAFIRLDNIGNTIRLPYIYIAKYLTSVENDVCVSKSTVPIGNAWKTMANWRTAIEQKGVGWRQMDLASLSLFCFLTIAKYGNTVNPTLDDFGFSYFTGHWFFIDGCSVSSYRLSVAPADNEYADYSKYEPTNLSLPTGSSNNIVTSLSYDYHYPWVMVAATAASGQRNTYYHGKIYPAGTANQQTITIGGHSDSATDYRENSIFSIVYNDGKMTESGPNYYYTRMVYMPFEGNKEEPILASNYKVMLGETESGNNASGYKELTRITTTTYKYYDGMTLKKTETITEPNKLRYWLHIPFNYKSNVSYPIYTYIHGSGGALYLQSNENGGSSYNRMNIDDFSTDESFAMRLLSAEPRSGAGHTGYIDAIIKPENETMYKNSAMGGSWDASFPSAWLSWVKTHPEDDGFFILPELNDELWFENRGQYTIDGVKCVLLDINNSYSKGFGEKISNKSYGHTYIASELSPNPWFQCLVKLQDELMQKYNINKNKNFVIGASLGGVSVYDLISHYPTRFSHAVPCCAASCDLSSSNLQNIVNVKIRNYYGNTDNWVAAGEFGNELVSRFSNIGGVAVNIGWAMGHSTTALSGDFENIINFLMDRTETTNE